MLARVHPQGLTVARKRLMRAFVALSSLVSLAGLVYAYALPPESLRLTRDGVPHHAPPVAHPATGEPLPLEALVRHFKGERR